MKTYIRLAVLGVAMLCLIHCSGGNDSPTDTDNDGGGQLDSRPVIHSFASDPGTIAPGGAATLSWVVEHAVSLTLSPDIGDVTGSTFQVSPVSTTTYTLTAANSAGTAEAHITVTVTDFPRASNPVEREGSYFGFDEQFNRYYTDPDYEPERMIYVSPSGSGNGETPETPASVSIALEEASPGTMIRFLSGTYTGCYELGEGEGGTYDKPIILYAERNENGSRAVTVNCCESGRRTCINLEAAEYVAVDGFELVGGDYGVRAVGADFDADAHQKGIAVLDCEGHGQNKDPFFTGQSDWAVFEGNTGYGAGSGDGHGMYISNGSDWNIVRENDLHSNASSDFQINADPHFCCTDLYSSDCDAVAGSGGQGGKGASDFMLVENNYFHHGLAQGANFTSVRHSLVRNNIFALYERHGVSFWQETENPELGSRGNIIEHNLFVSRNNRQMLQFVEYSTENQVKNNVFAGVAINGEDVGANADAVWMEVDDTVSANVYDGNYYYSGRFDGRVAEDGEVTSDDFDVSWFNRFPAAIPSTADDFKPVSGAPFLDKGALLPDVPYDREGTLRVSPVDIGPYETGE